MGWLYLLSRHENVEVKLHAFLVLVLDEDDWPPTHPDLFTLYPFNTTHYGKQSTSWKMWQLPNS
jgi:hypothetical protein